MASAASNFRPGLLLLILLTGCGGARVRAWPEADALFHQDPRWRGGDGAYSVPLGDQRVLWLFGDSFIAVSTANIRGESEMIHNSIAIQTGANPAAADMEFFWSRGEKLPSAYFEGSGAAEWLWPLDGVRLGERLLLFFMRVRIDKSDALGFAVTGTSAFIVENPDEDPARWRKRAAPLPEDAERMLAGSALLTHSGLLYAYTPREPDHAVFLQRWRFEDAARGDLSRPQWWCGARKGWRENPAERAPVFEGGQTEFSLHRDRDTGNFIVVQTIGFGATEVGWRSAPRPEGPWSKPASLFRPKDSDRKGVFVYAAKAHPHLEGGGLPATYVANRWEFAGLVKDDSVYYPRFIRINR